MESEPTYLPGPEQKKDKNSLLFFKGRGRLASSSQLVNLRFNLIWAYLSTIGLSSITLKAVDTLTHSVMEGKAETALVNTIAVFALGGSTLVIGRMAVVATSFYVSDIAKRIKGPF